MATQEGYASFLLRLWRTNRIGSPAASWQSEIQHIQSGQHWTFGTIEALLEFLREQNEFNFEQQQRPSLETAIPIPGGTTMSTANKSLMQQAFANLWSTGDLSVAGEFYAPTYVSHDPNDPGRGGVEGLGQSIAMLHKAFPDLHFAVEDQIAEGDKVATRWTATGTHRGDFLNVPATGKSFAVTGTTISRISDGKIQETWTNWDMLGLLQQLGAVPAPVDDRSF